MGAAPRAELSLVDARGLADGAADATAGGGPTSIRMVRLAKLIAEMLIPVFSPL
jgi:hypothetical protein